MTLMNRVVYSADVDVSGRRIPNHQFHIGRVRSARAGCQFHLVPTGDGQMHGPVRVTLQLQPVGVDRASLRDLRRAPGFRHKDLARDDLEEGDDGVHHSRSNSRVGNRLEEKSEHHESPIPRGVLNSRR